jgi:beta-glucosidase
LEMAALNMHLNFSPAVSIARDIRWGRTYESMGQTADIVTPRMQAYLRGVRGIVIPTVKHYVGDGATDGGIDQGNATITEAEIRQTDLVPYVEAVRMGVPFIMASYHAINGVKLHGHAFYLNDILKEELGFEGVLLSDYNAVNQLPGDFKTQLVTAINAGIDMLMQPFNWKEAYHLVIEAVEEGEIASSRIDDAVARILKAKHDHGLIERPNLPFTPQSVYHPDHQDIAFRAAYESMVLLKDELDAPISDLGTVHLAGPASDHVGLMAGGWTTEWQGNPDASIGVGVTIREALEEIVTLEDNWEDADTIVIALAETSYAEWEGDTMEPSLVTGLAHPGNQAALDLAAEARARGMNVIGLLVSGRPLVLDGHLDHFDRFVAMFLPGSEGGRAIAALLNHDVEFSGRLSYYWPSSNGHLDYDSMKDNHLFPIGHGIGTTKRD